MTESNRRGLGAALLNASGLGAGYAYLGLWGLAAGVWLVDLLLVITANALGADGSPVVWVVIYLLWLAVMVRGGWKRGRVTAAETEPTGQPASAPARPWLPFAVGGLLIALVATGLILYRGIPQGELEKAGQAHAAGRCEEALEHYDRAARSRYEFALAQARDDARFGAESCRLLLSAEKAEKSRFTAAIKAYDTYVERYDGRPPWDKAETRLATTRMAYADSLATKATEATSRAGTSLDLAYRNAAEAYLDIRTEHPDAPEADELADRFDALYTSGTKAWPDGDRPCDAIDDLQALTTLADLDQSEPTDIAGRAEESLPKATYACGRAHYDDKEYCTATDDFQRVVELAGVSDKQTAQAKKSLGPAMYECGVARYKDEDFTEAKESLQQFVDDYPKNSRADRASDLLIAMEIADLTDDGTGELPPPTAKGGAPGGTVTVEIINDSPEPLEILYTGPETGRATLKACGDCTTGSSILDGYDRTCDASVDRPSTTLHLTPGDYQMVVSATSGSTVTPYSGDWDLASGTAYSDCYYITQSWSSGY